MHESLTGTILRNFYETYHRLGYGFLERVYQNALAILLERSGLSVLQQVPIQVRFEDVIIGEYYADMLVNDLVIVEIKAAREIGKEHEAQLLNYLKATRYEVGLLLNFGPQARHVRKVFGNGRKGSLAWAP